MVRWDRAPHEIRERRENYATRMETSCGLRHCGAVQSVTRMRLHKEKGAQGVGHAVLTGAIACTLVLSANHFWQDLSRLAAEIACNRSAGCVMRVEQTTHAPSGGMVTREGAAPVRTAAD